jgi:signal transduction histidine kinase
VNGTPVELLLEAAPAATLRSSLALLARTATAACAAQACLIAWHDRERHGVVRVSPGTRWDPILNGLLAEFERDGAYAADGQPPSLSPGPGRLALLTGDAAATELRVEALTASVSADAAKVAVIVLVPHGSSPAALQAVVELIAGNALAIVNARAQGYSRSFWRKQAIEVGERLARTKSDLAHNTAELRRLDAAVIAASRLRPRNRFAGLGALFAATGPFAAWIVAVAVDGKLNIAAVSALVPTIPALDHRGVIGESFQQQATIIRTLDNAKSARSREEKLFARFPSYVCVPFQYGVVALASGHEIDQKTVARAEALASRINPVVRSWMAEAEAERLGQLVRNLGMRMFGAIDAERARIARDLHDHQAQLLAAARIALEAGPDEARGIFKQLEDVLRLRVRELRPATLGRSTLKEALRYELRRLADAGIKGRLVQTDKMSALTRPVQQLCYQVAREALSNVLRHAEATRVEIGLEKRGGRVRLSILDNGKGIHPGGRTAGMGLSGLAERLALMGGKLKVESHNGSTRLIAEIPELA